jgi:hypothetical protein
MGEHVCGQTSTVIWKHLLCQTLVHDIDCSEMRGQKHPRCTAPRYQTTAPGHVAFTAA